jgi:para-nitrobenzyl esterase
MRPSLIAFAAALAMTPFVATAQAAAPAAAHYTTSDTTVGQILDDPAAKAVVDKHLPGLLAGEQIDMAREMTLRTLQQFAPDRVTDAALADIDADFVKLPEKK